MSVSFECCVVSGREISASGLSLVQRTPTVFGVSECDREAFMLRRPCAPLGAVASWEEITVFGNTGAVSS
jgi:hypothetical protein